MRLATQGQDVVRHRFGTGFATDRIAHGRHFGGMTIGDTGLDILRRTAKQPLLVGQVGEALATLRLGTMALGTIGHEQVLAHFAGFRIRRDGHQVLRLEGRHDFLEIAIDLGLLIFPFLVRGPAQGAGVLAQAGIEHEITDSEEGQSIEHPHPPTRQRIVQFL